MQNETLTEGSLSQTIINTPLPSRYAHMLGCCTEHAHDEILDTGSGYPTQEKLGGLLFLRLVSWLDPYYVGAVPAQLCLIVMCLYCTPIGVRDCS